MLRQIVLKHGDVPLPRAKVDEYEDVNETQLIKREHDEELSKGIMVKIKELMDISDNSRERITFGQPGMRRSTHSTSVLI